MNKEELIEFKHFAINAHEKAGNLYGKYPYELHLDIVQAVHNRYKHLVPLVYQELITREDLGKFQFYTKNYVSVLNSIEASLWGHDLIEDANITELEVLELTNPLVNSIVYSLTNIYGSRADKSYYKAISYMLASVYCKLCDRIANVEFSKLMGSKQLGMYKYENPDFVFWLYKPELKEMFDHLNKLFDE